MTAGTASRGVRGERRAEMLTGYALVAIPLLLYATLFFGAMIYAAYISLWRWGLRGARNFLGFGNYEDILSDPIFWKAVTNTLYYVAVWVPLTMALGLFLAVIVNQKLRGQTFFRAAFYFPTLASSAAITVVWLFLLQPDGLFNGIRERNRAESAVRSARVPAQSQLAGQLPDGDELDHHPQRLDDVRDGDALLPDVPPDDQQRGLRGGGHRRGGGVADVQSHHVPALEARPTSSSARSC